MQPDDISATSPKSLPGREEVENDIRLFIEKWPTAAGESAPKLWHAWEELSADDRSTAVARVGRFLDHLRKNGRTLVCNRSTYLRERRWEQIPASATAAETNAAPAVGPLRRIAPYSRDWWVLFSERIRRGEIRRATTMADFAETNTGATVEEAEAPSVELARSFSAVSVRSSEWVAWRRHLEKLRVRLPTPAITTVAYFPTAFPETEGSN